MESRREVAQERMPASAALARRALPATRDARAGSPPWRVPERTSSSQTPARCAVLPTLPAESQAGQPAPQDWYRCGARSECYHGVSGNKTKASICISHPSVCTIRFQLSAASAEPYTCSPVVPKLVLHLSSQSTAFCIRARLQPCHIRV